MGYFQLNCIYIFSIIDVIGYEVMYSHRSLKLERENAKEVLGDTPPTKCTSFYENSYLRKDNFTFYLASPKQIIIYKSYSRRKLYNILLCKLSSIYYCPELITF